MAGRHLHHCHRLQAGLRGLGSAFLIAPLAAFSVTHALGGRVPRQPRGSLGRSLADWPGAFGRCWLAAVAGWQGKRAVLLRCCRRLVLLAAESLDPPCDCLRRTAELPCCRDLRHLAGRHGAHDVLTAWLCGQGGGLLGTGHDLVARTAWAPARVFRRRCWRGGLCGLSVRPRTC
jgi:hypothetical protein